MKTSPCLALAAGWLLVACSPADEPVSQTDYAVSIPSAAIDFDASFGETVSGPLVAGGQVSVRYDAARLAECEGTDMGNLAWGVTGYYQLDGGEVNTFEVLSPNRPSGGPVAIELEKTGELSIWFEASNKWGCHAWDSNYGNNYNFYVGHLDTLPSWAGMAQHVITRATCSGQPCPGDYRALDEDFYFDTWARQRAVITDVTFEAWEPGVTDWDNPDLWRTLDAQIHYRFDTSGPLTSAYVDAERRGNNARYAFSLRAIDPLGSGTILDPSDCPAVPLEEDGALVFATMEYYLSIGDIEIRPAFGEMFVGRYADYADLYAVCGL